MYLNKFFATKKVILSLSVEDIQVQSPFFSTFGDAIFPQKIFHLKFAN